MSEPKTEFCGLCPTASVTPAECWDGVKDAIYRRYIQEGGSLADTMELMRETYGFAATISQYERQLNKWGFQKDDSIREYSSPELSSGLG